MTTNTKECEACGKTYEYHTEPPDVKEGGIHICPKCWDEEDSYTEEHLALAQLLKVKPDDIDDDGKGVYSHGDDRYLVLDDDEADEKWNEALDDFIENVIYPDLPPNYQYYFDEEKWKDDARHDGRGHSLALYDGVEHEQKYLNTVYYIYQID
jgi:hypothetical protein